MWTHINGVLVVEPLGNTDAQTEYVLKTVLDHLPVVESRYEGEMEIYVNRRNGTNYSSSTDEYDNWTNLSKTADGNRTIKPNPFTNTHKMQTEYIITLYAGLRHVELQPALKQLIKWLNRLSKRVWVLKSNIIIESGDKKISIVDADWLYQNFEMPNPQGDEFTNWSEHLMYQYIFTNNRRGENDGNE